MNYVFNYHARRPRPLWKGVVYEGVRLLLLAVALAAVGGIGAVLR